MAQIQAYALADNKLALNAGWDADILALEIAELQEIGFESFDTGSLVEFMNSANGVAVPNSREILNPGPAEYPQVKQPFSQIAQWKDGKLLPVTEGTDEGWVKAF